MAALTEVTLSVPAGSFYGVVGPNGAGKTAFLSLATGTLRPDAGTVSYAGLDLAETPEDVKRLIGVVPDQLALPERLTGQEVLEFSAGMRGLPRATTRARVEGLLVTLGLDQARHRTIAGYSAGMRKKLGLANALLHVPHVLLLDEPLEAVDPVSAAVVQELLQRYVDAGRTVIFSSHVMALVELLCDHVAVFADGKVVESGPITDVISDEATLQQRFLRLLGTKPGDLGGLAWLFA